MLAVVGVRHKLEATSHSTTNDESFVNMPEGALESTGDHVLSGHVLVADGDPASRAHRQSQLVAAGFRVSTARTGFEAIVKASCQLPDLIVIDDSISDIEPAETGRLITTCPVTSHIPIVLVPTGRRLPARLFARIRRGLGV